MSFTPEDLAARYDDPYRKAERIEIDADRFDRAMERDDDGAWGVGALVIDSGCVLFVREDDTWLLPGGRLETDEPPEVGAMREVEEETGVTIELTGLAAIAEQTFVRASDGASYQFYFATFLGTPLTTSTDSNPGRPSEGIDEAAWLEEVPENTFDRDLVCRLVDTYV